MKAIIVIAAVLCLVSSPIAASAKQAGETRVYKPGDGVSAPILVKEVKPQYNPEAKQAKIEGSVTLECVVETDGAVGDVHVTKSLDPGLDREAIKAAKQWRFEPGTKDGKAVPVLITLEMTFTLK